MYHSDIPTQLDAQHMTKKEWVKSRTQELYDMLPQTTLEEREKYTNIRDEILELNYSFFGYVAKNQYVTDPMATYEDKLHSAVISFCDGMWAKYKFCPETDNPEVKKYRSDLSFAVFFKPRLSECIRREFNTIKYSLRRQVCMKAAAQLGKHWGQITKEDIANVNLSPQEMQVLEAIFSTQYDTPFEDTAAKGKSRSFDFIAPNGIDSIYTENYNSLEDLIVHEMIEQESKLDDAYLLKMAQMYGIPYADLEKARPIGESKLKQQLEECINIKETFESNSGTDDTADSED